MAVKSPTVDKVASNDPFQISRLAEELESRDLRPSSSSNTPTHDLPLLAPLSHSNPHLTAPEFSIEEFLLSRAHTSLPDLRSELRDYLGSLKEELVKLINDDYAAFISLSTDLRGEGVRLERLKYPLGMLKSEILTSRGELQFIQDAIQEKLEKRSILREEKAILHLLLKISELVTRLESLLLIATPVQECGTSASPEVSNIKLPSHFSAETEEVDDRARGNRAKHLARVAAEYTQLLYHVSKARASSCVYVDEIQWRMDRIRSTLSSDLDHLFGTTLISLTSPSAQEGEKGEKAKLMSDLTECLRTYDVLRLWRDAEDVIKREVVRSFVKKTIFPGALTAPHSPLLPHTPFPLTSLPRPHGPSLLTPGPGTAYLPRTPYSPFTAFASKQNPFEFSPSSALSSAHLLDEDGDLLARVYNQVLRFVERDLKRIMELAEKVSTKVVRTEKALKGRGSPKKLAENESLNGSEERGGYEIMANVVWAEFGRAIMDEMGSVVFAAGKPDEFRQHHETTQAFVCSLEFLAPSVHSIEAMRSHPVYSAFQRRWQLPVYFQLRWKEIVSKLEDVLAITTIEPISRKEKHPFVTNQAAAVWVAISTCWSAEVFLPELNHRFWKFTLQILSRYKTWLEKSLPAFDTTSKGVAATLVAEVDKAGTPKRISTPTNNSENATAETAELEDSQLRQFAAAMVDIKAMHLQVLAFFREGIVVLLPETSGTEEDALKRQISLLDDLVTPMLTQITTILTRRSCDALQPASRILTQFRAMSNKRTPTESSPFVPTILRPIRNFFGIETFDGPGEKLKDDFLKSCATEVFENICHRYIHHVTTVKRSEEALRRLKKGQKSTFTLFGGSNMPNNNDRRDEERTRSQMILDVNAFSQDAQSLGIDVLSSEVFNSLHAMVHADLIEEFCPQILSLKSVVDE